MRLSVGLATAVTALCLAGPAAADVYADALGKCMVDSSSEADRVTLVRWIFGAISVNPRLADMTKTTQADRDQMSRKLAALTQRLLTKDCRQQAVRALKNEGDAVFQAAFSILGRAATQSLMGDPATQREIGRFAEYLDKPSLQALAKEAGLTAKSLTGE
jgi:hypothetical protein